MNLSVIESRLLKCDFPLAKPFGFGVVKLTSLRHAALLCRCDIGGESVWGLAGENLAPKWFEKDPRSTLEQDVAALGSVVASVARLAVGRSAPEPFTFWRELYADVARLHPDTAPLVRQLGVSLVERAVLDAWCRHAGLPFWRLLAGEGPGLGLRLAPHRPPATTLKVRHTVGLLDPLHSIPGYPHATELSLKLKLSGDLPTDLDRLRALALELPTLGGLTVDGNENYSTPDSFARLLEALASPELSWARQRLAWVEQPLNRVVALSGEAGVVLRRFPDLKVIIDESDASLDDLPRALSLGYAGTSHKNCKGVFKSVLARQRLGPAGLLSGEDLTMVAPWSQAADLAVAAAVNVIDIERNGHIYAEGLSGFPPEVGPLATLHHPELYHSHHGITRLRLGHSHSLDCTGVNQAPLGWAAPHPEHLADLLEPLHA